MPSIRHLSVAALVATLALPAFAQDAAPAAPSAAEIKKVTEYFLKGKDAGPILLDFVACKKTGKVDNKLVCEEPMGERANKGENLVAFVRFFAPKGSKYEDLKVKFLLDGEVRTTSDFTVTESWTGSAIYKQTPASKIGTWEMQVLRGDKILGSNKIVVH